MNLSKIYPVNLGNHQSIGEQPTTSSRSSIPVALSSKDQSHQGLQVVGVVVVVQGVVVGSSSRK
jgi:hypothetical protein